MRIRWRPDNAVQSAAEIAAHAAVISQQIERETDHATARKIYGAWCDWAEDRRVCQQIVSHIDEKYWFKFPKAKRDA